MTKFTDAAIYARSACMEGSDLAIADQIRTCMSHADRTRLRIPDARIYSDAGFSGGTVIRPGLAKLLEDAQHVPSPFTVVLMQDMSRLARNLADVLRVVSLLKYLGISIYFVNEALISSSPDFDPLLVMHRGSCSEYLEPRSHAVRRGKAVRVAQGFSPGRCYGYDHVPVLAPSVKVGGRSNLIGFKDVINPIEAARVQRIFDLKANGLSCRGVAALLDSDSVPPPHTALGKQSWNADQIRRIVNNTRYLGRVQYGHTRRHRNPVSGKMESRQLPKSQWQDREAPELRIVSDDQWRDAHKGSKRQRKGRRDA